MPTKSKSSAVVANNGPRRACAVVGVRHVDDIRDDMLSCKVCLSQYNTSDQRPRALHCHHTFCERCIQDHLLKQHKVTCPLCKSRTSVTGVENLPINVTAVNIAKQQRQINMDKSRGSSDSFHEIVVSSLDRLHPTPTELRTPKTPKLIDPSIVVSLLARDDQRVLVETDQIQQSADDIDQTPQLDTCGGSGDIPHQTFDDSEYATDLIQPSTPVGIGAITPEHHPRAAYVGRFDKHYGALRADGEPAVSFRPGTFQCPSYVACCLPSSETRPGDAQALVVDRAAANIQLFAANGDLLSVLHVSGAQAACFVDGEDLNARQRVAVTTGQSVMVFDLAGNCEKTVPLAGVVALAAYQHGFVAAHQTRLSVCSEVTPTLTMSTISSCSRRTNARQATSSTNGQFRDIVDVAVCRSTSGPVAAGAAATSDRRGQTLMYVLDVDAVYVMDPTTCNLLHVVQLSLVDPTPGVSSRPVSVAVDPTSGRIIVADSARRQVLMYECGDDVMEGRLHSCLVRLGGDGAMTSACGHVAVSSDRILYVIVVGSQRAEVKMYRI